MTGWEGLAVLAAGLGAGVLTSTVGVASLLSFPVLLAVGSPRWWPTPPTRSAWRRPA